MSRIRNIIIITLYALLAGVFFFGGYALGEIRSIARADRESREQAQAVNLAPAQREEYYLIIENGRLNLYRTNGAVRELMAYEDISAGVFPSEDIAELKRGVEFDNLSDAQILFENFVS